MAIMFCVNYKDWAKKLLTVLFILENEILPERTKKIEYHIIARGNASNTLSILLLGEILCRSTK
jgi:hypothetical protein